MRGLADMSGIHDATSRRVFLDRDIVRRNQTLEMELKYASNFSPLEMRAARCPLFGVRFERIFSLAFLSFSPVAVFRGFDSNSRNGGVLRLRRRQAKSSHPKHPILMQLF